MTKLERFIPVAVLLLAALGLPFGLTQQPKKAAAINNDVWSIALSKDGKIAAASSGWWDQPGDIGVWNLETRKPLQRFAEDLGISSVALSSDGKLLASGSWTGHLRIYDWAANKEIADFEDVGISRIAFSPDNKLIASAAERKTVHLWDVENREFLASLDGDLIRFQCVLFSPDGSKVLAGGGEFNAGAVNHVVVWDVKTRQQIMKLVGHTLCVSCIAYSPDANTIVTGSADKTIRFWDANTGTHLKTLKGHSGFLQSLIFTADGKTLISSGHDRTIRFWDVETGIEKEGRLTLPGSVRALQLTPDGKSLLVAGGPKLFKVYDADTRTEVAALWNGVDAQIDVRAVPLQKAAMDEVPVAVPARTVSRTWLLAGLLLGLGLIVLLASVIAVRHFLAKRSA